MPYTITKIDKGAFRGCNNITDVIMPKKLAGFMGSKLKDIFGDRYKQIKFTYTK